MPGGLRALIFLLAITSIAAAGVRLEVPFLRQQKQGCGTASVAMVLYYWAAQQRDLALPSPPAAELHRQLYVAEDRGVPLADMKAYLQERGFHSFTLRATWTELEEQLLKGRPLVVGMRHKPQAAMHYAVVVGQEGGRVWLNDPARRKPVALERSKFDQAWGRADRWMLLAVPRASPATGRRQAGGL